MRVTVNDVRKLVETVLGDEVIEDIINIANKDISTKANTTTNNDLLFLAELYLSCALLLERMKLNGEVVNTLKVGDVTQTVNIDELIEDYKTRSNFYLMKYITTNMVLYSLTNNYEA